MDADLNCQLFLRQISVLLLYLPAVFATLFSLVHDKQGKECINEFQACYEGHLHYISWSTVSIPPTLQGCAFLVGNPPC